MHSLSFSGALAALIMGTIIFGLGGISWAVLLIGFFVSSSLLSKVKKNRKQEVNQNFAKGSRRDWSQVLANGGAATFLALLHPFLPDAGWIWPAYAASLAAANADTWSTELGILSTQQPRMITGFKKAARGTSGAVTIHGTLSGLAGSLFIALLAILFWQEGQHNLLLSLVIISISGLFGSLVDSLIGATLQAIYYCPQCHKETERHPLHFCGSRTELLKGNIWLNNEAVNLACTLSAALLAWILVWF